MAIAGAIAQAAGAGEAVVAEGVVNIGDGGTFDTGLSEVDAVVCESRASGTTAHVTSDADPSAVQAAVKTISDGTAGGATDVQWVAVGER